MDKPAVNGECSLKIKGLKSSLEAVDDNYDIFRVVQYSGAITMTVQIVYVISMMTYCNTQTEPSKLL